jgi:ferrochelatase
MTNDGMTNDESAEHSDSTFVNRRSSLPYDAVLVVSFGGPEGPDDVLPFLQNVLRGKPVSQERMLQVAEHYHHFGGVSPINEQNRALIRALERELSAHGPKLPVYWGNRNWHPLLPDTLREMSADGIQRALGFFTAAFSSYSGCRQYRENITDAQQLVGPQAPQVDKLRMFFNHPGYIEPLVEHALQALKQISAERRGDTLLLFTAHSIPEAMAAGCNYVRQLNEACELVAEGVGQSNWRLVYQSRSGPPEQPWLEPDVCDFIQQQHAATPLRDIVILPIGFTSDHMEVLYDLDVEVRQLCDRLGIKLVRARTVGTHPRFVQMIRELIVERITGQRDRPALGELGPSHDVCPEDCCLRSTSASR